MANARQILSKRLKKPNIPVFQLFEAKCPPSTSLDHPSTIPRPFPRPPSTALDHPSTIFWGKISNLRNFGIFSFLPRFSTFRCKIAKDNNFDCLASQKSSSEAKCTTITTWTVWHRKNQAQRQMPAPKPSMSLATNMFAEPPSWKQTINRHVHSSLLCPSQQGHNKNT